MISSLADDAFFTLTRQAFYNLSFVYLSSTRTDLSATGTDSYSFQGIQLKENPNMVSKVSVNTYWSSSSCRAKCFLNNQTLLSFGIKGQPFDNLEVGLSYQWEIVRSNAISYFWNLGNGTTCESKKVIFKASKVESRKICANVSVNGWFNLSKCFNVSVVKPLVSTSRAASKIVVPSDVVSYSAEDEVVQGTNYGKFMKVGNQIWISKDVPVDRSLSSLAATCPPGFRGPTLEEYQNLVDVLGANASPVLRNKLGFNSSLNYMTTNKSYFRPGGNGGDNNDWVFKGLSFPDDSRVILGDVNTYWTRDKNVMRCILNTFNGPFEINGLPRVDLYQGSSYTFQLATTNTLNYKWVIGNLQFTTKTITFTPQTRGRNTICITVGIFAGFIKSHCQNVFVVVQYFKDVDTSLTQSKYKNVTLVLGINPSTGLHFSTASSPLAPQDNGNVYLLYSEKSRGFLNVLELYPNGTIISGSLCNLTRKGLPLDLVSTSWGFAAYIRYSVFRKATVIGVFRNCSVKFEKTIMNNEKGNGSPLQATDQIMFYDGTTNTSQPFGMSVMFNPQNGRLSYARERLGLIFGHFNHFGVNSDGSNNDHMGSSFISLDENNGKDVKLGFSWGCSHSLNQANIWDGEKFLTASLGDGYPMGIVVTRCEGVEANGWKEPFTGKANRLDCSGSSELFSGVIPGNGFGSTAGRLGGLVVLNDTHYALLYSRRSASVNFQGIPPPVVNNVNEIAFVFFNNSFSVKRNFSISDGKFNNLLHVARYGRNILVGYSVSSCLSGDGNFVCPRITVNEQNYLKLVGLNGNNLGQISVKSLPGPDDFEVLADGRVAWVTWESESNIVYHYLTPP
eukprot:TRINITY_DN13099_c0_g1_i2.p1 TRINITY_DN13099_c0_g1~~TRINITY_DN13099_c0_g1_i2.p1  ORF type:complete len:846 (+),score=148.20 TRINITY_DN13099_c0_g1_i2:434-2971(+)